MEIFKAESLTIEKDNGIATLWLDVPGKTYTVFNRQVLADLSEAFDHIAPDSSLKLLLIRGRKKNGFVAGADLHEFQTITTPEQAIALSATGQSLFDKLERLPFPTVAVIHGPCLGGGLEFALACDYRVAIDHPKTQIGLPEIELGLVPGWGGTQRLPRVVGLERALQVILGGKRLGAQEALRWGLVDAVAATKEKLLDVINDVAARAIIRGKQPKERLPLRTWRQRLLESTPIGRAVVFRETERRLEKRAPDDMPAPGEALEAVRVGMQHGMAAGFQREREGAGRLAVTPACRNLVNLYFLREQARKLQARDEPAIRCVGVVGAGVMGAGIAQLAAIKGTEVVVQEINATAL